MPLYIADYLADTSHLSTVEHGAYMLLIMHYWRNGGLPDDDAKLARIARLTLGEWQDIRDTMATLFERGWRHKRVELELADAARKSELGSEAGKASGRARRERTFNGRSADVQRNANGNTNGTPTECEPSQPQPQPDKERKEEGILNFRKVGEGGQSGPRHGAVSPKRGTVFIRHGTDDWKSYAADYRQTYGCEPEPDRNGGFWFKIAGAMAIPPPQRLARVLGETKSTGG